MTDQPQRPGAWVELRTLAEAATATAGGAVWEPMFNRHGDMAQRVDDAAARVLAALEGR